MRSIRRLARAGIGALAIGSAVTLAACSGSSSPGASSAGGTPTTGGTAYFAENPASGSADYIFPMVSLTYDTPTNLQFQYLMYRPLYWFGQGSQPTMNTSLSLAAPPVYTDGNTTVTIHLKSYQWSDGKPVTSRDVIFWINLLRANALNWAAYLPGGFPDNVTSVTAPNPQTVTLKLKHAYDPGWFTQTQLAQIFPLPQHVWDKTSVSSPVGNYDQTTKGAKAVRNFLDSQAHNLSAYATNPLWQVVDGPWKLSQFRTDGYAQFSPNPRYSGKKPALSKFVMEPFTSETAEFDVLRSGGLTYGFVPLTDLSQKALLEQQGYKIVAWPSWSISYIVINFNNPTVGPIFRQLYVRQAMQELIDQPGYIKAFLKGNGVATNGPVPAQPASSYASPQLKSGFYHFNPPAAVSLLRSHGWDSSPTAPAPAPSRAAARANAAAGSLREPR